MPARTTGNDPGECEAPARRLTEKSARAGFEGGPLDDQQADERQQQTRHVAHDVVAVHVAEAGQRGVHEQRERQAHDGRHEAGQGEPVLPAARAVLGVRGVRFRAHERPDRAGGGRVGVGGVGGGGVGGGRAGGAVVRRRSPVVQAVARGRHAHARARPVDAAVGGQHELAGRQLVAVRAVQPLVVRQRHAVGPHQQQQRAVVRGPVVVHVHAERLVRLLAAPATTNALDPRARTSRIT